VGFIGSLVGAFPQAGDKLDVYDTVDSTCDAVGVPAGLIRSTDEAEKIAVAQGAKTLSEAQVGDRNGLEALTGAQPMQQAVA
jgi:hypothetical protein